MNIIREINRGGFGVVEEVEVDGNRFARKVFSPSFEINTQSEKEKLIRRFCREAKIQEILDSRFFIPITGKKLDIEQPYYLMPLAEKNFNEEIKNAKQTGIAPIEALNDILISLEELHKLGYIHRDLKPANVLFHEGRWKLSDFGLILPPKGTTTKITSYDSNWGSAGYCAPEQALQFRNADEQADIYSFGCILHDIFAEESRIPYRRYTTPGPIGAIIEKCTELKKEHRFKTVRTLRSALITVLSNPENNRAISENTANWVEKIKEINSWDETIVKDFLRFLIHLEENVDRFQILRVLDETFFQGILAIDPDLFKTLAQMYCDWVEKTSFIWSFCDVLVLRLKYIFECGDLELKASSVIAAAKLAETHHRWYVMEHVRNMCGPQLEENIARRIVIEIMAREEKQAFIVCNRGLNHYHEAIGAVIKGFDE